MTKVNNLQGEIWTKDDDVLLAETILRTVRNGGTIIDGCRNFEEVTEGKRTEQASKFRWHTRLSDQYKAAYELAKEQGKSNKSKSRINQGERYERVMDTILNKDEEEELDIEDVFVVVKKFRDQQKSKEASSGKIKRENKRLKKENEKLKDKLKKMEDNTKEYMEIIERTESNYKQLIDSLQVLRKAGIQINIPEPEENKYVINNDGTVERL